MKKMTAKESIEKNFPDMMKNMAKVYAENGLNRKKSKKRSNGNADDVPEQRTYSREHENPTGNVIDPEEDKRDDDDSPSRDDDDFER